MANSLRDLGSYSGYNHLDEDVFMMLSGLAETLRARGVSRRHILAALVRVIRFQGRTL